MLDLFWQRILPYQMTRIQEPDLLIDHDSGGGDGGGGSSKRFLGRPMEPFGYSGISQKLNSSGDVKGKLTFGKWFPFTSHQRTSMDSTPSPLSYTPKVDGGISSSSHPEENPIIIVHNNNNRLDILNENTRWSSSPLSISASKPSIAPPSHTPLPPIVILPQQTSNTKNNDRIHSKSSRKQQCKNSNVKNNNGNNSIKNNDNGSGGDYNTSNSTSNINNKSVETTVSPALINNCDQRSGTTTGSCLNSSNNHHLRRHPHPNSADDGDARGHLLIRYIHCNERPNKKQLVTLGIVSVLFLVVLVILLALFLGPSSTRTLKMSVGSSEDKDNNSGVIGGSDSFISSDIISNLKVDDDDIEDNDSYEDTGGETPLYSSSTVSSSSSPGLDLKKVSKLSWDLLNSNQDASSRGGSGSSSRGGSSTNNGVGVLNPLGVSSTGEGEIILPAKMIYTSSGDSGDLVPSQPGNGDGPQNKKRSCCRTQKYSQVIKRDGCEPLTIVNKMCFGQCVSVWVPGLFASFPVCRPSKSTFKTVTLTCGRNKEKRKRVRIEKVKRCSCMEIEPTAASL